MLMLRSKRLEFHWLSYNLFLGNPDWGDFFFFQKSLDFRYICEFVLEMWVKTNIFVKKSLEIQGSILSKSLEIEPSLWGRAKFFWNIPMKFGIHRKRVSAFKVCTFHKLSYSWISSCNFGKNILCQMISWETTLTLTQVKKRRGTPTWLKPILSILYQFCLLYMIRVRFKGLGWRWKGFDKCYYMKMAINQKENQSSRAVGGEGTLKFKMYTNAWPQKHEKGVVMDLNPENHNKRFKNTCCFQEKSYFLLFLPQIHSFLLKVTFRQSSV